VISPIRGASVGRERSLSLEIPYDSRLCGNPADRRAIDAQMVGESARQSRFVGEDDGLTRLPYEESRRVLIQGTPDSG
jgi:hypothetical protein